MGIYVIEWNDENGESDVLQPGRTLENARWTCQDHAYLYLAEEGEERDVSPIQWKRVGLLGQKWSGYCEETNMMYWITKFELEDL